MSPLWVVTRHGTTCDDAPSTIHATLESARMSAAEFRDDWSYTYAWVDCTAELDAELLPPGHPLVGCVELWITMRFDGETPGPAWVRIERRDVEP